MSAEDGYAQALEAASRHAREYLAGLRQRPVGERAGVAELQSALGAELPEGGEAPAAVVEELARAAEPGLVATGGPRYFGFVIGGALPAALAADWLTAAWDQNAGLYVAGPSAAVAEEVAGRWMLELLALPESAAFGLTSGGTMANFTGLAAGRHAVLKRAGWDVEARGLQGAPGVRVLVGEHAHSTIFLSLRMLGLGDATAVRVRTDEQGRMLPAALRAELESAEAPAIVCAQAGEVNTGCFDPLEEIGDACREHDAWLHVDGAIGLWVAASPKLSHLTRGLEHADSWCTDAHKWLNVPYDCGFVAVADAEALRAAVGVTGAYLVASQVRDESQYVPELSRRARGLALYAALRSLGRSGVRELVERCCELAELMAAELEADPRLELLNEVVINQVLVALSDPVDQSGELTAAAIERIQSDGTCWLAGTSWRGRPAIRLSICNWQTSEEDIRRSAAAIREAVSAAGSG